MSKNLDVMLFKNWTHGGSAGFARYEFSEAFTDENGVEWGAGPNSYLEVATSISGSVVTVPAYLNFPETEAAIHGNGVTVTCYLLDENRKKREILFADKRIYTSLDSPITLAQLVLANGASRLQRDSDVWTKEQVIDYVNTRPPAAKMTSLVYGIARLDVPADDPADPIVPGINSPRLPPTPGASGTAPVSNGSAYVNTNIATQAELDAHTSDTTDVHGIVDTSKLVVTSDPRVIQVSNYADYATALAAVGATPTTLQVTGNVVVSNESPPATITHKLIRGGKFTGTTGQTFNPLGPIIADDVKIFDNFLAGQGTVSFVGNKYIRRAHVNWWGAVSDGSTAATDNSAAFQAAWTCVGTLKGVVLEYDNTGESWYSFASPLSMNALAQVKHLGCGSGRQGGASDGNIPNSSRTELRYTGTGTASPITGYPTRGTTFENMAIRYSSALFTGDVISFNSPGTTGLVSAHNWVRECHIGGASAAASNARSCVYFCNNVGGGVEHSTLALAVHGVIGRGVQADGSAAGSSAFANGQTFRNVKFDYISDYAIVNPGAQWNLLALEFEFGPDNKGRAITTEDSTVNGIYAHTLDCQQLYVAGCGFYDSLEGGTWIKLRSKGATFVGNWITLYNDGATKDGKFLELWASTGDRAHSIVVVGNGFFGTVSSYTNTYIDQTNADLTVMSNIIWEGNAGNTIPIPPPPDLRYAPRTLSSLHYLTGIQTPSGGIINLDVNDGHAFINATANTTVRLDEDTTFNFLKGRVMTVTRTDASTNTCVVVGKSGATINGRTDGFPLTQYQTVHFLCVDGTNWVTFAGSQGARKGADVCVILPKNSFAGTSTTDVISDSNNAIKAMRFVVEEPTIVTKISIRIGVAGNIMGLGIYDAAGNKLASIDSLSISGATTTVTGTLSASVLLQPNVSYLAAWAADTTTPTASSTAVIAVGNIELWNAGSNKNYVTAANSLAAGAMPATLGALTAIMAAEAVPYLTLHN